MAKKILCSVFGGLMTLIAFFAFISLIIILLQDRPPAMVDPNPITAATIIGHVIPMLGLGVGGFFLLRAALRAFRKDKSESDDELLAGDYDDDDIDGYDTEGGY